MFTSELGNILLVERRVLHYRLVLTCERGLLEIDISHLPDLVIETARVPMRSGFGVVGRIDSGAFAVTAGTIEPWGLTNMGPAMLVGSPIASLLELPRMLRAIPGDPAGRPDTDPDGDLDGDLDARSRRRSRPGTVEAGSAGSGRQRRQGAPRFAVSTSSPAVSSMTQVSGHSPIA